jgi:hypothetical protein
MIGSTIVVLPLLGFVNSGDACGRNGPPDAARRPALGGPRFVGFVGRSTVRRRGSVVVVVVGDDGLEEDRVTAHAVLVRPTAFRRSKEQ